MNRPVAVLLALTVVAAAGCSGGKSTPKHSPSPSSSLPSVTYTQPPPSLPATSVHLSTAVPPWLPPAVIDNGAESRDYVIAAGLPYSEEMLQVHYHAHLDINVNGKAVVVPQYVGWIANGSTVSALAPLHTHDDSGIIHIENSVPATFILGQFFIEWGVKFTPKCLGPYCTGGGKDLAVFVDGTRYTGDPTQLVLKKHQEIAIEYGTSGQLPQPPSSYAFPSGL